MSKPVMDFHGLPSYGGLPIQKLAQIFNNTSATYKFYWFLGILDSVESGKKEIDKINLFAKMLSNPWYTVNFFKLSFGRQDKIQSSIKLVQKRENLPITLHKTDIEKKLKNSKSIETQRKLYHFDKNVPHWFLSPWYKGKNKQEIYSMSKHFQDKPPYALFEHKIIIDEDWYNYFQIHAKLLKEFCYWNLTLFLQSRNPNVPDIPNKLIKPAKRNSLTQQRNKYWTTYLKQKKEVRCIFTEKLLDPDNYALDHFIPYAFVSHDLIWNLIPVDPLFNSSKNSKLPHLDLYFKRFFDFQKEAFFTIRRLKPNKKFEEEYHAIFPSLKTEEDFTQERFYDILSPLVTTAHNNGFEFLKNEK